MGKLPAILPAVAAVAPLLAGAGCAIRDDFQALRADVAALRAASAPSAGVTRAGDADLRALRADVAALRASIDKAGAARGGAPPAASAEDVAALRADVAALRSAAAAAARPAGDPGAAAGPPPPGYRKVSTLVKLPEFVPGLGTLYVRPGTLPAGPFLAYDRDDRLASTIYMIPVADVAARKTFEHLAVGHGAVRDVDLYHTPGHPGVEQPHYHVVLWHLPEGSAKLR